MLEGFSMKKSGMGFAVAGAVWRMRRKQVRATIHWRIFGDAISDLGWYVLERKDAVPTTFWLVFKVFEVFLLHAGFLLSHLFYSVCALRRTPACAWDCPSCFCNLSASGIEGLRMRNVHGSICSKYRPYILTLTEWLGSLVVSMHFYGTEKCIKQ